MDLGGNGMASQSTVGCQRCHQWFCGQHRVDVLDLRNVIIEVLPAILITE